MTASGWRVRRGTSADIDPVLELERGVPEAPHWSRQDYMAIFNEAESGGPRRCLFVAETVEPADLGLLGFAVGAVFAGTDLQPGDEAGDRWGDLESVAVAPSVRRLGVGRGLCVAVLDWCREAGAGRVGLEVRAASSGAIALYEGLEFRRTGIRQAYYTEPGDDAVLMEALLFRS